MTPPTHSASNTVPTRPVFQQKFNELLNDALDQLVERQLILHSFDAEGYKLPDSAMDEIVQDRIKEQFGDRVTLMKTLQARGMTFEEWRQQVRDQFVSSQLRLQNVQREVVISHGQNRPIFTMATLTTTNLKIR